MAAIPNVLVVLCGGRVECITDDKTSVPARRDYDHDPKTAAKAQAGWARLNAELLKEPEYNG